MARKDESWCPRGFPALCALSDFSQVLQKPGEDSRVFSTRPAVGLTAGAASSPPLAATCGLARWGSAPEPPGTQGQAPGLQAGDAHPSGLPLRVGPGQLRGRQLLAPPPVPLQTARRPAPAGCLPDRLSLCLSTGRRVLCHHSAPSGRRHFWIQRDRVCLRPLRYCGARRPEAGTGLRPAAAPEGRCLAPFPRRLSKVAAPPRSHSWWGQIGNPTPAYRCHPREARIPLGNFKLRETNTCKAKLPLSS